MTDDLECKFRSFISHATGGRSTDVTLPLNTLSVMATQKVNDAYKAGQKAGKRAAKEAIEQAIAWFEEYADQHDAKADDAHGTSEEASRRAKADRNRERAAYLRSALPE